MALSNMETKRLWEMEVMTAAGRQNVVGDAILGSVSVSPHPDDVDLVRVRWESITNMPRAEYDAIVNRRDGNLKTAPVVESLPLAEAEAWDVSVSGETCRGCGRVKGCNAWCEDMNCEHCYCHREGRDG
ncbi:hypothetical protein SALGADO_47 [Arthrobacter phage Salgado]|uniref:Uncharacterized protein n=1 Tax=Arthrobacter phage Salgado TaxID=1772314 RepID=A0A0U4IXM4_9CAUD|nr:hypothetical protein KMD22_gp47 [Arthrobacter phage Salgado]ALY10215.1 hypothetical protein SALGADO_47 [Arthrobacter phage Salgado]